MSMSSSCKRSALGLLVGTSLVLGSGLVTELAAAPSETAQTPSLDQLEAKADQLLAREDLKPYRGWIKYLRLQAMSAVQGLGEAAAETQARRARLADWLGRIEADPELLGKLRGVQEWAYESPADGSGQPFRLAIPSDYEMHQDYPLSIYMHGYSGNHLEHSEGMTSRPGYFDVAVLGRSRGGGYRTLSEADVLGVVAYIQANWPVDADRIHLSGGSMGGGATFRLGARYPHLWASGRPTCGFATFVPMGNLLTLPLYATHSADDPVVSVLHARWPMARLRELGGEAIFDETNGLGHAAWDYTEGNRRADQWYRDKSRPRSQDVRRIDYTATDGEAVRGWWAEIAEWGPSSSKARFVANAKPGFLALELSNIRRLKLRLSESPFETASPLRISVNGAVPFEVAAPLPAELVLAGEGRSWAPESSAEKLSFRLHTPGGPSLLYNGEPLLIVYGTGGDEAARLAMLAAAKAAAKSPNAQWLDDSGEAGKDGVPHSQNLYGHLNIRPDTEVSEADLRRCHLVLIGTASQNRLVARLAGKLPVSLGSEGLRCSDGETYAGSGLALGLVHYNPLAPDRLVYWVASDNPAVYAAGSFVPGLMGGTTFRAPAPVFDLMVTRSDAPTFVAVRSFDSRWGWQPRAAVSRLLPDSMASYGGLEAGVAAALRRSAGTDLCLLSLEAPAQLPAAIPGVTRVSDIAQVGLNNPVCRFEISGTQLLESLAKLSAASAGGMPLPRFYPGVETSQVDPKRTYSVCFTGDMIGVLSRVLQLAPPSHRLLDFDVAQALEESLGR